MAVKSLAQSTIRQSPTVGSMLAGYEGNQFHHLETIRLGGNAASVEFTNLSRYADYQHLQIRGIIRTLENTTVGNLQIRFNGVSTSSYYNHFLNANGSSVPSFGFADSSIFIGQTCGATAPSGAYNPFVLDIVDAFQTDKNKVTRSLYGVSGMTNQQVGMISGLWLSTNAISSIQVVSLPHTLAAGSRVSIYGLKVTA